MLPNQQRPGNRNIMINILSFTASALLSISCLVASSYVNGTSHSIMLFSFTISYSLLSFSAIAICIDCFNQRREREVAIYTEIDLDAQIVQGVNIAEADAVHLPARDRVIVGGWACFI
jgi:hypothetical protein